MAIPKRNDLDLKSAMRADLGPGRRFPLDCPQRRRCMCLAGRWRRPRVSGGAMGGGTSIARIASGAYRNRQSLQDWSRVGAVTPGSHLRWLPGARVEFPYREPHDGGRIRDRGTTPDGRCGESALRRMSFEADGGVGGACASRSDGGDRGIREGRWAVGRRSRESRLVPIEIDNPFRIGLVWGRSPQVSTCGGYLGLG
jgi:hypothetical protein